MERPRVRTYKIRTKQERLAIVEESLRPGASVSQVARAHDVNANLVFHWRKQYREGRFDAKPGGLVPVRIVSTLSGAGAGSRPVNESLSSGSIEIQLGQARVRIEGSADVSCVRAILEVLR
jgi:transposase